MCKEATSRRSEISDKKLSTCSFHSAFKDLKAPGDGPKRESIEIRTVAFF